MKLLYDAKMAFLELQIKSGDSFLENSVSTSFLVLLCCCFAVVLISFSDKNDELPLSSCPCVCFRPSR
jgi:hypothetical protein